MIPLHAGNQCFACVCYHYGYIYSRVGGLKVAYFVYQTDCQEIRLQAQRMDIVKPSFVVEQCK